MAKKKNSTNSYLRVNDTQLNNDVSIVYIHKDTNENQKGTNQKRVGLVVILVGIWRGDGERNTV